jgi:hypothetical protein
MICKDDDVCPSCLLRRKRHDCGHEPFGWGPDMDGEYGIGCPDLPEYPDVVCCEQSNGDNRIKAVI